VQAHRGQARRIDALIHAHLESLDLCADLRLLDIYGGSGAMSLAWAREGAHVTLIESFGPAAECAQRGADEQGLGRMVVRRGDAASTLRDLTSEGAKFDAVITNPPRRGMAPAVRTAIADLHPRAIAYVSCDPETLARDLDHFLELGYGASKVFPIDMIPLTDQVETLALLIPVTPPSPKVLYQDDDVCITEKTAHVSASQARNPADWQLVWSTATGTSGFAVWSKNTALAASFRKALAHPDARKVHFALVRGITSSKGSIGGKTRYRRMARVAGHSLLQLTAGEEKSSQVRRDLARIGHPVAGDHRYGHAPTNRHFEEKYMLDRPFLHCKRLEFQHPRNDTKLRVDAALPGELDAVLQRLGYLPSMSRNE
jgi:23S rRNA (uracil1939-C5)-methyltransferase